MADAIEAVHRKPITRIATAEPGPPRSAPLCHPRIPMAAAPDQIRKPSMSTPNPTPNSSWISDWRPEDETFWNSTGKAVAKRNLIWSIVAEHIGFSVWLIWSIVATKLPQAGFHYSTDELFQLVALPGLIGSLMRFPYTFAVTTFGGRNWTIFSAAVLFIPTLSLAYFVSEPDTPFW